MISGPLVNYEIARDRVEFGADLGQGQFGKVVEGSMQVKGAQQRVAVKFLSDDGGVVDQASFVQEAIRMSELDHKHIVRLLGVHFKSRPAFIVLEYMAKGDLKQYLTSHVDQLSQSRLLAMCQQVASAMVYLADVKFVHRDIAARNILLDSDETLKLGDFGMARDIYLTEYYRRTGTGMLPLRWMAPESLFDGIYNAKTDIWMFGMLMIEMFTYGELPWSDYDDVAVLSMSKQGSKHAQPMNCPDEIYNVMLACWEKNPLKRASATAISEMLGALVFPDTMHVFTALRFNNIIPNSDYVSQALVGNTPNSSSYTLLTGGNIVMAPSAIAAYYQVPASTSVTLGREQDDRAQQGVDSGYKLLTIGTAAAITTGPPSGRVLTLKPEDDDEEETHL